EIKGAQDLKMLPELVQHEVGRQTELVKLLGELRSKDALHMKKHTKDVSQIFQSTKSALISGGLKGGAVALAQKMPNHKGLLGREIQKGRRYGSELSDYAKRAGVKGLIHSDEAMDKYSISEDEQKKLREALGMGDDDAFLLVVAPKEQ